MGTTRDSRVDRRKAIMALLLLVPAPSIGTLAGMVLFPGTALGKGLFAASKLWLFVFPVVWLKLVDRGRLSLSPARNGGLLAGLAGGTALSLLVLLGCFAFGRGLLDCASFADKMAEVGLGSLPAYMGGAAYWILVNSVLEEYAWRWFVYGKCEALFHPAVAVAVSALFFSLHHFIALQAFCAAPVAVACSVGVLLGGATWSFMYLRYRSIWPGYLSHAVVDLCVFGIGAAMLFGGR